MRRRGDNGNAELVKSLLTSSPPLGTSVSSLLPLALAPEESFAPWSTSLESVDPASAGAPMLAVRSMLGLRSPAVTLDALVLAAGAEPHPQIMTARLNFTCEFVVILK